MTGDALNDAALYEEALRLTRERQPFALATVVASHGSSPRKAGAKMLVRRDGGTSGTVGGGKVEAETVAAALAAMRSGEPALLPFELCEENGFVCGGGLTVYVEPALAAPGLVIAGAGHVGRAVAELAHGCGFHVTVVDERAATMPEDLPFADRVLALTAAEGLQRLQVAADTAVIIATPGHDTDFAAVRSALATPAAFIGLLGSRRKKEVLLRLLAEEGYAAEELQRIQSPVGVAIGAETPREIAVSIVAELIRRRRSSDDRGSGDPSRRRCVPADGELQAAPSP